MEQTEFDWETGESTGGESIDERFAKFHAQNPEVYQEFKRLAHQVRDRGHKHYGAKGIFEVLRYYRAVDGRPGEPFKLNNNYTSRYVRLLIEEEPEWGAFFELRELKAQVDTQRHHVNG